MARPLTFDLDDLVEASLGVIGSEGWDALSMRSAADALGVTPMALYRVVPDARRLRQIAADAVARQLPPPPPPSSSSASSGARAGDLVGALRRWAHGAYRELCAYPG